MSRLQILVLPSQDGRCSPQHVVDRLKKECEARKLIEDDQRWIVCDVDHWTDSGHIQGTTAAIREAKQADIRLAFSNPCFELWLLLHHRDVREEFSNCAEVTDALRIAAGGYNKANIRPEQYPISRIKEAIERARAMDAEGDWPNTMGSHVYKVMQEIFGSSRPRAGDHSA